MKTPGEKIKKGRTATFEERPLEHSIESASQGISPSLKQGADCEARLTPSGWLSLSHTYQLRKTAAADQAAEKTVTSLINQKDY